MVINDDEDDDVTVIIIIIIITAVCFCLTVDLVIDSLLVERNVSLLLFNFLNCI